MSKTDNSFSLYCLVGHEKFDIERPGGHKNEIGTFRLLQSL